VLLRVPGAAVRVAISQTYAFFLCPPPAGIAMGLSLPEHSFEGKRAGDSYWCVR
jgi:hypothetical protein